MNTAHACDERCFFFEQTYILNISRFLFRLSTLYYSWNFMMFKKSNYLTFLVPLMALIYNLSLLAEAFLDSKQGNKLYCSAMF